MQKFINTIVSLFKAPELRKRVLIILGLLMMFRLTANVPLPDVDLARIKELLSSNQFLGILNVFSGNTLSNMSIAMLGVGPYITAIIIMQLLTLIYPKFKQMYYEEGEAGKAKFNQYARLATIPLAFLQGFGFLKFLQSQNILLFSSSYAMFRDIMIITAGTMFLMWIGELITEQKLANGVSLIIFSGIVARGPELLRQIIITFTPAQINNYIIMVVMALLVIGGIAFITEAERRVPLNFAKRVRGTKIYGGSSSYLPIRVNQAGVIPIIFALSILLFPVTFGQILSSTGLSVFKTMTEVINQLFQNQLIFSSFYFILVFIFTYFYTSITFEPNELATNFQKSGAFIPGIRPGKETAKFLHKLVTRITLFGALFLGIVAVLPNITQALTGLPFVGIGGTSILILVSVAIETLRQIDAEISVRRYDV
ncbi:MAG: preprotein translocase subunit SecY [Patescibacteria group bacterium]